MWMRFPSASFCNLKCGFLVDINSPFTIWKGLRWSVPKGDSIYQKISGINIPLEVSVFLHRLQRKAQDNLKEDTPNLCTMNI